MSRAVRRELEAILADHPKEGVPFISRAIIGMSYNIEPFDDMDAVRASVRAKVRKDEQTGQRGRSHLFYRLKDGVFTYEGESVDFTKFNFLIDGVPSCVYTYLNVINSDLDEAVFVTNPVTQKILEAARDYFGTNGTNVRFVDEGKPEELSFTNTFTRGVGELELDREDRFLFIAGDLPLSTETTINTIIYDPAVAMYDGVLELNVRQQMSPKGTVFPIRNYHIHAANKGNGPSSIKEPNFYVMNGKVLDYLQFFTSSRKNGGIGQVLIDLLMLSRKKRQAVVNGEVTLDSATSSWSQRIWNMTKSGSLPRLLWHGKYNMMRGIAAYAASRSNDRGIMGNFVFDRRGVEKFIEKEAKLRLLFRPHRSYDRGNLDWQLHTAHADFTRVNDLDAIENLDEIAGPLQWASLHRVEKRDVYRHAEDISRFRDDMMHVLGFGVLELEQYYAIMNEYARAVGFGRETRSRNGAVYDAENRLNFNIVSPFDRKSVLARFAAYSREEPRHSPVILPALQNRKRLYHPVGVDVKQLSTTSIVDKK